MKKKLLKVVKILIISSTISLSIFMLFLVIVTYNMDYKIPDIINIELYDSNNNKYLSYSNGKKQSYVKLDNISNNLINAFICIEDKRFFEHHGIDLIRVGGAMIKNIKNKEITEGASTITQQYVKNIYLTSEKTWKRKINEMLISIYIERNYSKEEILEGYLNSIYFDHGIYGVEDASIYYFNKHAKDLNIVEACCIASIPKGPVIFSPIKNPTNNLERRNLILKELYNDEIISYDEYNIAINTNIECIGNNPSDDAQNAPFFQDAVISELNTIPEIASSLSKGLKIYTTLNTSLYTSIIDSINKRSPNDQIQTAVYAIEPTTGHVLAIVGGREYEKSSYNRATSSMRQPGSTIKPFLYLTALENGFTVSNTFLSEQTTFYFNNKPYSPSNFQNIYANFDISMIYALATSDNIYAVKTHLFLGVDKLSNRLKDFKFSGEIPNIPSLCLGTKEVSVKELTEAYAILANQGTYIKPTLITKVTSFDDEVIYEPTISKECIANKDDVYLLSEAMTSVFDNNLTYNIRPTGVAIKSLLRGPFAAKSGSTNTDNWMIGYSPEIVLCVWTGYDDNRPIITTDEARFGKYIWADVIEDYYDITSIPHTWYDKPDNIIGIELNPITGFYASFDEYSKILYFKKENLPWFIKEKIQMN